MALDVTRGWATILVATALAGGVAADAQAAGYASTVLATPGLQSYWRLGEAPGTPTAADATGHAAGSYLGAPALGARGALPLDADTAVRFDGTDDELQAPGGAAARTIEGWFDWESGVAVLRDSTAGGGWILAFDNAGKVAYRVGGTTFTTTRATADLRTGWHHLALTVAGGATAFYIDGALVHSGTGAGTTPAALPRHVMRNGTTSQFTRGRADEIAVYDTTLAAATIGDHFDRGRDLAGLLGAYSPSLRYTAQEGYFADSAAEMTDNYVAGSRTNYLVNGSGARLAAANPADPLANLSLGFLGDPAYADGRAAASTDFLDAANSTYQQDAQRMRAAGYGDRVYGRAVTSGGRTFLQLSLIHI